MDPRELSRGDREDIAGLEAEEVILEPDRTVARRAELFAEEEEAELAEEDILEIADIEDEIAVRKGDGPA